MSDDQRTDEHDQDEAKSKEERRQTRLGCGLALVLVVAAVSATVLIVGGGDDAESPPPAPAPSMAWYEGGTLHEVSRQQWQSAQRSNRMATSADWAATWAWMKETGKAEFLSAAAYAVLLRNALTEDAFEHSMLTLRAAAIEMMTCLDTAYGPGTDQVNLPTNELAVICAGFLDPVDGD